MFLSLSVLVQSGIKNDDASTIMADKVNAYLVSATKAFKFKNSALLAKDGHIVLHKAYGWKYVIAKTTIDTTTQFPVLSIT